jgi:hypothetical protein
MKQMAIIHKLTLKEYQKLMRLIPQLSCIELVHLSSVIGKAKDMISQHIVSRLYSTFKLTDTMNLAFFLLSHSETQSTHLSFMYSDIQITEWIHSDQWMTR